jgi:hypothetical protein
MKDDATIKEYAKSVIRTLRPNLRKNIEVVISVTPSEEPGGVIEVQLVEKKLGMRRSPRAVEIKQTSATVNDALEFIPQNLFGGNLQGVQFRGTNISMSNNRIVFIKGDNDHWSETDAIYDVNKAINPRMEAK